MPGGGGGGAALDADPDATALAEGAGGGSLDAVTDAATEQDAAGRDDDGSTGAVGDGDGSRAAVQPSTPIAKARHKRGAEGVCRASKLIAPS